MTDCRETTIPQTDLRLPAEETPLVLGAVVETLPGKADQVAERLRTLEGVDVVGSDQDRRVALTWECPDGRHLSDRVEKLVRGDEHVLGVYPTFAGRTDGD